MKRILFSVAILFAGLSNVNAQQGNFKVGAHFGLPIGTLNEGYSVNLGVDVAYLWKVSSIIELGATTGFSNYFGKNFSESYNGNTFDFDVEDFLIIPLAASAKFNVAPQFFIGTDIGYAFFIGDNEDTGAFYYQPKVGMNIKKSEIYLGYKGMSKYSENVGSINLGYAYNF